MEIFLAMLLFAVGIVLIVKGGDFFVDASTWIAKVSGIPEFIIGATIVSVATTLPELLVSVMAAVQGKVDMATGNAVGSVTANVGLIMALSILFMPSVIKKKDYMFKSITLMVASALICVCGFVGEVNIWLAIVLIAVFVAYMADNIVCAKKSVATGSKEIIEDLKTRNADDFSEGICENVVGTTDAYKENDEKAQQRVTLGRIT